MNGLDEIPEGDSPSTGSDQQTDPTNTGSDHQTDLSTLPCLLSSNHDNYNIISELTSVFDG